MLFFKNNKVSLQFNDYNMPKQRITYVDTLKGFCILLVVLMHCGLPVDSSNDIIRHINDALRTYRMPTYYFLSGIFFKTYNGLNEFTRRKVNNIIIPLFFFYILNIIGCVLFSFCTNIAMGQTFHFEWNEILDIFYRTELRIQAVIPLWFLLSLFWANLIFYILKTNLNYLAVFVSVSLLAITGFFLESHHIKLPCFITSSLIGLPYFVLGYYVKRNGWLESRVIRWKGILQFIIIATIVIFFARDYNMVDTLWDFLFYRYIIPFGSVLSLFWLCKCFPHRIPVVTFLGRYSLIVLGTHMFLVSYLYILPVKIFGEDNKWLWRLFLFISIVILELFIVPFMRDRFPRFTAQQDFFKPGWTLSSKTNN